MKAQNVLIVMDYPIIITKKYSKKKYSKFVLWGVNMAREFKVLTSPHIRSFAIIKWGRDMLPPYLGLKPHMTLYIADVIIREIPCDVITQVIRHHHQDEGRSTVILQIGGIYLVQQHDGYFSCSKANIRC